MKCLGGLVVPSRTAALQPERDCPSVMDGRAAGSRSSFSGFCFKVERKACSTAFQPGVVTTRPFAEKEVPPQSSITAVSS